MRISVVKILFIKAVTTILYSKSQRNNSAFGVSLSEKGAERPVE